MFLFDRCEDGLSDNKKHLLFLQGSSKEYLEEHIILEARVFGHDSFTAACWSRNACWELEPEPFKLGVKGVKLFPKTV